MVRCINTSRIILVGCLSLLVNRPAYASFPLPPRVTTLAYASDYAVGQADLMLSVLGNPNHNNLYIDPALSYGSNNQNEADIGLGYRWVVNQAAILGGYLFGGYSRIDNNARLWVVNPGIEALGPRWDVHLNAYFPMGDRHTNVGNGLSTYFTGHSEFGGVFIVDQYVGNGVDAKVGYQLFPGSSLKGYLGSYYFSPTQTNNIWGGAAGIEYWLTQNVKMVGSYTYDNLRHSTYAFGIGIEWGGTHVHRVSPAIEERLTDPVERYLSELGRGSMIPSNMKDQSTGSTMLLANNIAFFSQTGGPNNGGVGLTLANCTFENPCGPTDFTTAGVTTLGGLLPNTQLYFNGGTYTSSNFSVTLVSGQSMQSRSADYSQPAAGSARSSFDSITIGLPGNNTLTNIVLTGNSLQGLQVKGPNNVITGSQIGSPEGTKVVGINILSTGNILVDNTNIFSNAVGVGANNGGAATIQNSQVNVTSSGPIAIDGVIAANGSTIHINNVQITMKAGNNSIADVNGILVDGGGSFIDATNTTVSLNASSGASRGLLAIDGEIAFKGNNISVSSSNGNASITDNFGGAGTITVNGTVCQVNGTNVAC